MQNTKNSPNCQSCFFEKNDYGFKQKRIYGENVQVPIFDKTRGLDKKEILNPTVPENSRYGSVTKYLAIDCEMDHVKPSGSVLGHLMPCKVSIVNSSGHIVLDTLVQACAQGQDFPDAAQISGYNSLERLHGVKTEWLQNAPTFEEVRKAIMELTDDDVIFIGHGVAADLKVMGLSSVAYYCTHVVDNQYDFPKQPRKLKDLVQKHLNGVIQQGHHSSIVDARAALALFLKMKSALGIELDGPVFLLKDRQGSYMKKKNRSRAMTDSKIFHRQAFKCLADKSENVQHQDSQQQYLQPQQSKQNEGDQKEKSPGRCSDLEKVLQGMILKECAERLDVGKSYKFNKKALNSEIRRIVGREFRQVIRTMARD